VDLDDIHRHLLTGRCFSLNGLPEATLPRPPGRRMGVSERLFPYWRQRRSWAGIDHISGVFDNGLFSGDAAYGPQEKAIGLVATQLHMIMKRGSQMIGSIQLRLRNRLRERLLRPAMPAAAETILKMFLAVSSTGRFALGPASIP
jgi:hypothetical protein